MREIARTRLPDAYAALFQGNSEALTGFTEEEVSQFAAMLTRLIANLDQIAGAESQPGKS